MVARAAIGLMTLWSHKPARPSSIRSLGLYVVRRYVLCCLTLDLIPFGGGEPLGDKGRRHLIDGLIPHHPCGTLRHCQKETCRDANLQEPAVYDTAKWRVDPKQGST